MAGRFEGYFPIPKSMEGSDQSAIDARESAARSALDIAKEYRERARQYVEYAQALRSFDVSMSSNPTDEITEQATDTSEVTQLA